MLVAVTLAIWVYNPYAALLLVPALHLWLSALNPGSRLPLPARAALLALGVVPVVLVVGYYALTLGFGPLDALWSAALLIAGGAVTPLAVLEWSIVLGCMLSAVAIVALTARQPPRRAGSGHRPRAGHLRRARLARRHQVGSAALSPGVRLTAPPIFASLRGPGTMERDAAADPRHLLGADPLGPAAGARRRRDPGLAGAGDRGDRPGPALPGQPALPQLSHGAADRGRSAGAHRAAVGRTSGSPTWPAASSNQVKTGDGIGHIEIPKIGASYTIIQGTDELSLEKGPGHYPATAFPGMGQTVAIAGHRTTYLAPFRHLDALKPGDRIILTMPYGRFTYVVQYHRIVLPTALWVTNNVGYDRLVLSACNPLYSAAQRIIIFARLRSVQPLGRRACHSPERRQRSGFGAHGPMSSLSRHVQYSPRRRHHGQKCHGLPCR